jgi:hypothetical protein
MYFGLHPELARERRRETRHRINWHAWLDPGGSTAAIDCVIVDRSSEGMRIRVAGHHHIPDEFHIQFSGGGRRIKLQTVWRAGSIAGTRIVKEMPKRITSSVSSSSREHIAALRTEYVRPSGNLPFPGLRSTGARLKVLVGL